MRFVVLALALAAVSPALARQPESASPPAQAAPEMPGAKTQDKLKDDYTLPLQPRGRFSFAPVDEGFLRFDHKSGEVTLCKPGGTGWSCAPVADKSLAVRRNEQDEEEKALDRLGGEISGLKDAVAGLKDGITGLKVPKEAISGLQKDVAALRPPPHPVPPDTVPPSDETGSITLKRDIARARGFITDTWSRLVDMIENLRKDMIHKGGDHDLSRT